MTTRLGDPNAGASDARVHMRVLAALGIGVVLLPGYSERSTARQNPVTAIDVALEPAEIRKERGNENWLASYAIRQRSEQRHQRGQAGKADRLSDERLAERKMQLRGRERRHVKQDDIKRDGSTRIEADANQEFLEMCGNRVYELILVFVRAEFKEGVSFVEMAADKDSDWTDQETHKERHSPAPTLGCLGRKDARHEKAHQGAR
jgi:hypothetical protein